MNILPYIYFVATKRSACTWSPPYALRLPNNENNINGNKLFSAINATTSVEAACLIQSILIGDSGGILVQAGLFFKRGSNEIEKIYHTHQHQRSRVPSSSDVLKHGIGQNLSYCCNGVSLLHNIAINN